MRREKLTVRMMNALTPGIDDRIADTETRGLQVWISKNAVAFYFVLKHRGRQYHRKIGNWPEMKLDEARQAVAKRLGALANYSRIDAPTARIQPTIGDAVDHLISSCARDTTRKGYVQYLKVFAAWRDRKIADVRHEEVVSLHARMRNTPVMANHAVKTLATAVSRMYKALGVSEYANPARDVTLYQETPRKRFLDQAEAPAIISELEKMALQPMYRAQALALLMMIYTGQRKSNVLAMDYGEIMGGSTWIIPREKAKGKEDIVVPLNDFALDVLRKISGKPELPKRGPVFVRRGEQLHDVRKTMATACSRCGIRNLHIHDLRRSLGSWMLTTGVDIAVVSRTLGHKSIAVTERVYAHLLPGKISSATAAAVAAMKSGEVNPHP